MQREEDTSPGVAEIPVVEMTEDEWEARPAPREIGPRGQIKFDRLKADGFKSFPDRVEMAIEPGMTGVVGPNGCGKSNLLECLRWVFGETSAKRMRGAGMDDVIFGGTDRRPPRNVAEVALVLDNSSRTAPPGMNDADVLEVVRRIERGQGTSYKVNGKPALMREIHLLFQDNAAGANSSAIVSQGRVGSLINAKPGERKSVLEEAAGVSGLATRRHETELKVKGTETNLNRAEDALVQSSEVLSVLRRQAKQAQRRRELDGKIREAIATVLLVRKVAADKASDAAASAHAENESKVAQSILDARGAEAERDAAAGALPALRTARDAAESARARAAAKVEGIAQESERNKREVDEISRRLIELGADRKREEDAESEAEAAIRRLSEERLVLVERREDETVDLENASDAVEGERLRAEEADALVARLSGEVATREANHGSALRSRDDARAKLAAIEARLAALEAALAVAKAAAPSASAASEAEAELRGAEALSVALDAELVEAEQAVASALAASAEATAAASAAESAVARASAEAEGLRAAASVGASSRPVTDFCRVEPGYEAAVAAAFGQSLTYGIEDGRTAAWTGVATPPPSIDRATLAGRVDGAISAAAAAVLLVSDEEVDRLRRGGVPFGFVAVSKGGAFARWDGLNGRHGGDAAAAMERANRLRALDAGAGALTEAAAKARGGAGLANEVAAAARARENATRARHRDALALVAAARGTLATDDKLGEEARRALAVAESEVATARAARQEATSVLSAASDALASIPPDEQARHAHAQAKRAQGERREAEGKARVALERLVQAANQGRGRYDAVLLEEAEATRRRDQANARRRDLGARADEAEESLKVAQARPASSVEAVAAAKGELEEVEAAALAAAGRLAQGEAARDATERSSRDRDAALAALREARVRTIAAIEAAQQAQRAVDDAAREKLSGREGGTLGVQDLAAIAKAEPTLAIDLPGSEAKLARLERERDGFGEVNFLAESELAEQEKRYGDIEKSREELRTTLKRLRQAIDEIDREARNKLEEAFRKIDASFGELFVTLFSGGEAHLRLVGSEDILEAGLEIYASPPGKRLQVLSLLSGGEQALTAMALIFAAFLSNPAPICVLDEVDAPLDDANADRLCRLVEAMAANDATRFLVVTHNPLTMARMNRLYGVTMGEQGVSSLTRVDLDKAMEFVDAAK